MKNGTDDGETPTVTVRTDRVTGSEIVVTSGEKSIDKDELVATEGEGTRLRLDETTAVLDETTAVLDETTAVLDETTAVLDETTAALDETTAVLDETTAVLDETTAVLDGETIRVLLVRIEVVKTLVTVGSDLVIDGVGNGVAANGLVTANRLVAIEVCVGNRDVDTDTELLENKDVVVKALDDDTGLEAKDVATVDEDVKSEVNDVTLACAVEKVSVVCGRVGTTIVGVKVGVRNTLENVGLVVKALDDDTGLEATVNEEVKSEVNDDVTLACVVEKVSVVCGRVGTTIVGVKVGVRNTLENVGLGGIIGVV